MRGQVVLAALGMNTYALGPPIFKELSWCGDNAHVALENRASWRVESTLGPLLLYDQRSYSDERHMR